MGTVANHVKRKWNENTDVYSEMHVNKSYYFGCTCPKQNSGCKVSQIMSSITW